MGNEPENQDQQNFNIQSLFTEENKRGFKRAGIGLGFVFVGYRCTDQKSPYESDFTVRMFLSDPESAITGMQFLGGVFAFGVALCIIGAFLVYRAYKKWYYGENYEETVTKWLVVKDVLKGLVGLLIFYLSFDFIDPPPELRAEWRQAFISYPQMIPGFKVHGLCIG